MPLESEFSIIADSTEPSSPRVEMERTASPEPVKRMARTYGKARERLIDTNACNISESISRPSSRGVVHQTAPPDLSERVPSTSSPSRTHNSAHDMDDSPAASPAKFTWGWKAKLQAMDEDEDEAVTAAATEAATEGATSLFGISTLHPDKPVASTLLNSGQAVAMLPSTLQMDDADDVFANTSLSSKSPSNGPQTSAEQAFSLSSPLVAPRKRARRSAVYTGSDSENDAPKPSSSTSSSSSQPLHALNTPKSSHTTPPTSDDDMGLNNTGKGRLAAKKNAKSTRNVTPLNLVEEPVSEQGSRPALATKRGKVKAPTKKDREEMIKERVRLVAESNAAVPKDTAQKFTKTRFLELVQEKSKVAAVINAKKVEFPMSDPIETYSSPAAAPAAKAVDARVARSPIPDSDDEELPEVSDIFAETLAQQKKAELLEKKKRALQMQKQQAVLLPDSDDDLALEIVLPNPKTGVHEEDEHRRSANKKHISEARKQQLRLAQVGTSKMKAAKNSAAPLDVRTGQVDPGSSNLLREGKRLDQHALNRLMVSRARQEARKATTLKEEEWKKHGGRLVAHPEPQAEGLAAAFHTIAAKAAVAQQELTLGQNDDDEDASDEDWTPEMRGSASPEPDNNAPQDDDDESDQEAEENDENAVLEYDTTMVEENDTEVLAEPKIKTSRRMVVASDSEDNENENDENATQREASPSSKSSYRRATSSAELTEGEQDKENNAFDLGDNKENFGGSGTLSTFDFPPSPTQSSSATVTESRRSQWADALRTTQQRKPFQDLLPDDGFASPSQPSFTAKLLQSSQTPVATPGSSLKPFIGGGLQSAKSFGSFSQLFNGEADTFGSAPLLQPAFGGLFEESNSQKSGFFDDQENSENKPRAPLKRSDTLGLTQEVHAAARLQPGFQAADNLMRKADSIFEKEQAFLLEAAVKKPTSKPELYINDHGFLTQTRPAEGTPDVYRRSISPSQRQLSASPTQHRPRAPLRTLSYTTPLQPESPETAPLRRLRKNATPSPGSNRLNIQSPSTTPPRQRNAFDVLVQGAARNRDEKKQKLTKEEIAAFLENEAAESDEDDNFGFGKAQKDDDDDDGEDLDQTLDVLMDDNAMDEDTVAADRVMEKYKEQEEEYDQNLEKLHMAAIQGELRRKRTRGVGVDDSDDDSEDDGNARARRAMKKLRTSDRGDIKHLEANEATRSFAQTYNQSLKDDDDEFAYLNKETQLDDVLTATHSISGEHAEEYEDEEEEEEPPQTISTHEVRRQLREATEEAQDLDEFAMNPEDVSWIEKDEDEPMARVKTVNVRQRPKGQLRNLDDGDLGGLLDKPAEAMSASSKQWFNQENKSRNAGTSRSVGGSAITGHTKVKPKASGRAALKAHTHDSASVGKKGVKAEKSVLSAIADRSRHFA